MKDFVTEITPKATVDFFLLGIFCGFLYFAVTSFVSSLKRLLSKAGLCAFREGDIKELLSLVKDRTENGISPTWLDAFRGLFVLVTGILVLLMNYALTNGVPRIYTVFSALLGILSVKVIFKSRIIRVICDVPAVCIAIIVTSVSHFVRVICKTLAQKKNKNDILP